MSDSLCVGVLGAGQMGEGIAQVAGHIGKYKVLLFDALPGNAERALSSIKQKLTAGVVKGSITEVEKCEALERILVVKELEEFSEANLVIEAVREDVQLKEEIFYRLDKILPPSGLIASNTSSISITRLGRATERPDRVIGMHFMNPVPVMALVEVIPGIATSPETISTIEAIAEQMKKVVVRGIDTPGFIVNRILVPMVNEAIFLLQEGVHKEAIDTAMKLGTNHPMGPLTLADFVGLDTLLAILRVLHKELGEDKYRPCPLLVKYVEAGWLGKKVGRGFYIYK